MTIRRRLVVSAAAILTLLAANLSLYFYSDQRRMKMFEDVRGAIGRQNLINAIEAELNDMQRQVIAMGQTGSAATVGATPFETRLDALDTAIQALRSETRNDEQATIDTFATAGRELVASWRAFHIYLKADAAKAAAELGRGDPLSKQVLQVLLPKVLAYEEREVQSASSAYYTMATVTQRTTLIIFIISSIVSGLLAMAFSRRITRGLAALKTGADQLGSGNLDAYIALESKDEMSDLAHSFNHMAARLRTTRGEIQLPMTNSRRKARTSKSRWRRRKRRTRRRASSWPT